LIKNNIIVVNSVRISIFFLLIINFQSFLFAQCGPPPSANCQGIPNSELICSTSGNVNFTFDSFTEYNSGINLSGSTILRLKVLPNNASCKWILRVYIDNNPGGGTPVNEWETSAAYGTSGTKPTLDLLDLKVYNGCNTPLFSGIYRSFGAANGEYLDIINNVGLIPAGSCMTNVNGAGSYLSNYNEYNFTIDYKIIPGLNYKPGMYQISLRFCLVEDV
jgi:hypothetical protein